jgi:quinol---cytochrome c reductase cytochrome c subunit, bacillus type
VSDEKDFVTVVDSNVKKTPRRVAFVTRRTSAQVRAVDEEQVQTFPEVLFRAAVAIEALAIALVTMALLFNAPLEGIADPSHTPNPAKAPWYFLGLQEMLHYFPPVVAGVLVPGLVVMALIVIPYFNINVEADGLFTKDRERRLPVFYAAVAVLVLFLLAFHVYVALVPTLIVAAFMMVAAQNSPQADSPFARYLASKPLSYWIMTWFLFELVVLTGIGTFFRGPGWSWVLPWRS